MLIVDVHLDDQELVKRYIAGNEVALEQLLERHKTKLFSYILTLTSNTTLAEDIFQETFFKVIVTLRKGSYNEEGKFLPWVERIAHNLTIDYYRKESKKRCITVTKNLEGEFIDVLATLNKGEPDHVIENQLEAKGNKNTLRKLIMDLPYDQREVFIMRHFFSLSFKEISKFTPECRV